MNSTYYHGLLFNNIRRIFFSLILVSLCFSTLKLSASDSFGIRTVVIDAGHGGQDPGASGRISHEKDIVLAVALKLGGLIKSNFPDVKVIYTRSTDVFIPLHERADIANRNKADLFISIHANANANKQIYGSETYVMGLHTNERNLDVAKKENAVIVLEDNYSSHYEGYDPNSAESFIIFTLMQNSFLDKSLSFASVVQNQFSGKANRYDRGVKQAGFLVLWRTSMPSVLVELGFVTNKEEEKYLNSEEGQNTLATSLYKSFRLYKLKSEKKSVSNSTSDENPVIKSDATPKSNKKSKNTNQKTKLENDSIKHEVEVADNSVVLFRVQIGISLKPLSANNSLFKKAKQISPEYEVEEIKVGALYKYYIGKTEVYKKSLTALRNSKVQFPDAFLVAWKGDSIISMKEALNEKK